MLCQAPLTLSAVPFDKPLPSTGATAEDVHLTDKFTHLLMKKTLLPLGEGMCPELGLQN